MLELFDQEDLPYFAGDIDRLIFHCELNASFRQFFSGKIENKNILLNDVSNSFKNLNSDKENDSYWENMYY